MQKVSEDRLKQVVQLYQEGKTFVEIEKILHIGQVPIKRALKKYGIASRPAEKRPLAKEVADLIRKQIAKYYLQGHTLNECIEKFHATSSTVAQYLKEAGIVQRYRWTPGKIQQLVECYQSGMNLDDCAERFATNRRVCRQHLKSVNVPLRKGEGGTGKREDHGGWKEQLEHISGGYRYVHCPVGHPRLLCNQPYILEHHLVMEQHLKRYLYHGEVVHHKNKCKDDNRLDNLQLFSSNAEHLAYELQGQCPKWSEAGKKRIDEARRLRIAREYKQRHSKICVHQ